MNNPDYDDNRRDDEDADYPRRQPRWSGCGERPGCGADDCPTCRPGCDQSGEDEDESPGETIERLEAELTKSRKQCVILSRQNVELRRHLSPPPDPTFPAAPHSNAVEEPEQSYHAAVPIKDNGGDSLSGRAALQDQPPSGTRKEFALPLNPSNTAAQPASISVTNNVAG